MEANFREKEWYSCTQRQNDMGLPLQDSRYNHVCVIVMLESNRQSKWIKAWGYTSHNVIAGPRSSRRKILFSMLCQLLYDMPCEKTGRSQCTWSRLRASHPFHRCSTLQPSLWYFLSFLCSQLLAFWFFLPSFFSPFLLFSHLPPSAGERLHLMSRCGRVLQQTAHEQALRFWARQILLQVGPKWRLRLPSSLPEAAWCFVECCRKRRAKSYRWDAICVLRR